MQRRVRILLAWFERREAVTALLGFRMPEKGDDVDAVDARYDATRAALLARRPFTDDLPPLEPLPAAIAEHARMVLEPMRLATRDERPWRELDAGIIDLMRLISFQKAVALDDIENRFADVSQDDWHSLANLCLPLARGEEDLRGTFDKDGKGLTFTSFNPNLRISPIQRVGSTGGPDSGQIVGFQILFGTPHVHVVAYKNRVFLKDGYHRAFGLLARGITRVPCIFERARSFQDVHSGAAGFITQEYVLGTHPPLVRDFNDPAVSATVEQQSFRKVIRIRAEEFVIHV